MRDIMNRHSVTSSDRTVSRDSLFLKLATKSFKKCFLIARKLIYDNLTLYVLSCSRSEERLAKAVSELARQSQRADQVSPF